MLLLATGVPGTGKTLNTIKQILSEDRFKNRAVFFCGINGCSVPGWTEWSLEQCRDWWTALPENSILIIDESYKFAPTQATGVRPPDHIEKLAEHRHKGVDIFFICQHPTQLSTFVRKMCGNHFHYERKFGLNRSLRFEWQEVQADPTHWAAKRDALKKQIPFDKKIFSLYKSAEVHTHKRRIPFKVIAAVLVLVGSFGLVAKVILGYSHRGEPGASASVLPSVLPVSKNGVVSAEQYIKQYQPRIEGLPWTAPVYDKAFQVKTFPKPNCIINESTHDCRCYTQQGTRMELSPHVCGDIVQNGWFDPTKDENRQESGFRGPQQQTAPASSQSGAGWVMLDKSATPGTADVQIEDKPAAGRSLRTAL